MKYEININIQYKWEEFEVELWKCDTISYFEYIEFFFFFFFNAGIEFYVV